MRSVLLCLLLCLCLSSLLLCVRADSSDLSISEFDTDSYDDSDFIILEESSAEPASESEEAEIPPNEAYDASLLETDDEFDIQAEGLGADYLATLPAPRKLRLRDHQKTLPTITKSVKMQEAPASPKLPELPPKTLPRQVLSKRHAPRLSLQRLPIQTSTVTETRPVKMLPPLAPRKRAPQYRVLRINQEVIQPVVSTQPILSERVLMRTINVPTMQKQPVIQPIITQPVLTRQVHEQPITQTQMKYRNIIQTREVKQPEIREELKTEQKTEPQQTVEAAGPALPRLLQAPKKHH